MSDYIFDYSELKRKYARVYAHPIRCGFCCPVEWLEIIDDLSSKLEAYLASHPEIDLYVDQVKEKRGGLRFYVNIPDPVIDQYIIEAEQAVDGLESCYNQ